ncbi:PAS domain S-box protein [Haloarchaeobius sp. DFWS5]|uniref:PAS domain-containing protein n=1 Tax=Haloarchaeobius sp. DFWS5 TaxID=3446114 RepID=UPI003EB86657
MNDYPATNDGATLVSDSLESTREPDICVLCVDDDPEIVELTAALLKRENDRIATIAATSASDGLDRLQTEAVDCIVSDYQMSRVDGLAFLDQVRAEYGDVPFILFTGEGSEEIASEAISRGVTDYLQKGPGPNRYAILANRVENVVEQHRVKRTLERERTRHAALFQHTPDPIVDITFEDRKLIIQDVNSAFVDIFGFDDAAVVGQDLTELLIPESERDEHLALREQVFDGIPVEAEVRRQTVGEVRDFKLRVIPFDVTDTTGYAFAWYTDITELKERERELRESELQFRSLVEGVDEYAIFMLDPDGRVVTWNAGAERIKGYSEAEVLDEHFSVFYPDDVPRESLDQKLARAAREGSVQDEGWRIRKDGTQFWGSVTITAIYDEAGELTGFSKVTRDLTDRREREEALRRERDLVERVVETSPVGIVIFSPEGNVVRANRRAAVLLDLTKEEIESRTYRSDEWTILDEEGNQIPKEEYVIVQVVEHGEPVYAKRETYVAPNGQHRVISVSGAPILAADGSVERVVIAFEDITELKRHNDRLEEFASVVSHDLRNPLMVARTSLELARERDNPEDFDRIASALERMDTLIDDLLTLARKGRRVEETQSVALAPLVQSTWESIPFDDAHLEVAFEEYSLEADEARLRQLLENLLSNAVEHGGDGVTVTVGLLAADAGFYVADDGPGITCDQLENVFEHGYSTGDCGTGFGLSIVKSIAEAHGWTVTASESADGGARFDVTVG